jgi:type II secretory pathway pseudopilin PulG
MLELAVVMTIAGCLLAVVVPRLSALRDAHAVRSAIGELVGSFSLARQVSLARRMPVAVVFDTTLGLVDVRSGTNSVRRGDLGRVYGVVLRANRDSAVYDPRGLGYGVSNITVVVRRGNFVDTLTMARLGRVRW